MSWDIIVFNEDTPKFYAEDRKVHFPEGWEPTIMGGATEIREILTALFPTVDWTEPSWGAFHSENCSLEFSLGNENRISNFMIHAWGSALPFVMHIRRYTSWKLFDTATDDWLVDEEDVAQAQTVFQNYVDKVKKSYS